MMADVWYAGLRPYLADVLPLPSEAAPHAAGALRVTGFDRQSGLLSLEFVTACGASDHAVHAGPLAAVGVHTFDRSVCGLGPVGSVVVDVGAGDRFFVVAGRNGYVEGALGSDSNGVPYPGPPAIGPCYLPQRTGGVCP